MSFLKKVPDWFKLGLKLTLTVAALAIVFYKIDFKTVFQIIAGSKWWLLLLALAFFIVSKVISSLRLNLFFQNIDISLTTKKNLRLYWLGMFYNLFLPGGIGGDGYKIYLLNKTYKTSVKNIFQAVLLDRISGLSALVGLAIILTIFLPIKKWVIVILFLSIPLFLFVYHWLIGKFFKLFKKSFLQTTFLSILVQTSQLIAVFFIILALQISEFEIYLFIFLLSSVIATIPFTIGGVGARELTFLYAATWLKLDSEPAISISFIFFAITAIVSLYGLRYNLSKNFENQFQINKGNASN